MSPLVHLDNECIKFGLSLSQSCSWLQTVSETSPGYDTLHLRYEKVFTEGSKFGKYTPHSALCIYLIRSSPY